MATATKISVPRSVSVTEVIYQLLLSQTEAEWLLDLLRGIGGDTKKSARKYAIGLLTELMDVLGDGTRRFARVDAGYVEYAPEPNLP